MINAKVADEHREAVKITRSAACFARPLPGPRESEHRIAGKAEITEMALNCVVG